MRIMYARCCGLDVHKKSIIACVLLRDAAGTTQQEIRRFGTMTRATWTINASGIAS